VAAGACYLVAALALLDAVLTFTAYDPGVTTGLGFIRRVAGATPAAWMVLPFVLGFLLADCSSTGTVGVRAGRGGYALDARSSSRP
jgi:hypothetical protein